MADKDEDGLDAPKGKGKGMIIASAIGLVVIVGAAFVVTNFLLPASSSGEDLEAVEGDPGAKVDPKIVTPEALWETAKFQIEGLLVNLAGTGGRRYLKLNLTVEFSAPDVVQTGLDIEENKVKVKDCLITLLSGKTLEDVDGSDNKNVLKLEMIERFTEILFQDEPGKIDWIYYDQFLTQ